MTLSNRPDPDIVEIDRKSVWHHLTQHKMYETKDPMVIVKGKGMIVTDITGKDYLDATSGGVWSVNIGYGRQRVADAVSEQLVKMCYFAGSAGTIPGAVFAERLLEKVPGLSRVYYSNSGSEANEKGYKMVRQLAHLETAGKKHKIVYRNRDYHGTTMGSLSSSGQEQRKAQFGPFVPGFVEMEHCLCYRCPFGKTYGECNIECARDLERVIQEEGPDTVGSVVLEPITAGGGVIVPVPEYFPIIREICDKYGVLLHLDEVVCGFGRTGTWFGYEHFDITPDIVTMAKGTASGYAALSCTVTTEDLFNRFKAAPDDNMSYFRDISTFGGCTGGPAAAIACLDIVEEEGLVKNSADMGDYLMDALHGLKDKHNRIGDVRGKGLLAGFELVTDQSTKEPVSENYVADIAGHCLQQGLMIGRTNRSLNEYNNTVCLTPALITGKSEIDDIITMIDTALSETPHR
ncbi:MAG: aminotransferase class III-fold pyridoxal phosphate-dependent enzyme [Hyphomonadaceae bacterium]|nr:aminotransferase class III-fold pyridoxal phosphate-dependent enzyme [Hyphomonadaceae bacterium]